jgi:hypothetical protein
MELGQGDAMGVEYDHRWGDPQERCTHSDAESTGSSGIEEPHVDKQNRGANRCNLRCQSGGVVDADDPHFGANEGASQGAAEPY